MAVTENLNKIQKEQKNIRNYLNKYWGYTNRMIDEVMKTGVTPHRAENSIEEDESVSNDPISPQHYQQGKIQVIDFITDQKFNWLEGNIVKYISRYKTKNGVEDLKKAEFYIRRLIDENS